MNAPSFRRRGRHTHAGMATATPERVERVALPPGMPGPDMAVYVSAPKDEVPVQETPAARPLPVPPFTGPLEYPPDDRPQTELAPVAETPEMTEALAPLREKLTEANAELADPSDTGILRRTLDGLRNLPDASPVAWLRFIRHDGAPSVEEPLSGYPYCPGTRKTSDGRIVAGLWVGANKNGYFVLDEMSVARLDCLIEAATEMRDRRMAAREHASAGPVEAAEEEEGDAA